MTIPEPREFQKVGAAFCAGRKRVILADDMGLGKTYQAILACKINRSERALVICPASLKENWRSELKKFWPSVPVRVLTGNEKQRREILSTYRYGFLICNYEQLRVKIDMSQSKAKITKPEFDRIKTIPFKTVIVDEAHRVKNPKAQQTRGVIELGKMFEYYFALTGTPIENKAEEIWTQLHIIDPKRFKSFYRFLDEYFILDPMGTWRLRNPAVLRDAIRGYFIRRMKAQVAKELPEKTYQKLWVELTGEQRDIYDDMETQAYATLRDGDTVSAPVALAQMIRLKQIAVSPDLIGYYDGKVVDPTQDAKFILMRELLEDSEEKFVIFSQFEKAVRIAEIVLRDMGRSYVLYTGRMSESARAESVKRFTEDPKISTFLGTVQAGGTGLNLMSAHYMIKLDKLWTPSKNDQADDRIHRIGQDQPVTIYELLAKDTIDEDIERTNDRKDKLVDSLIGSMQRRVQSRQVKL